MIRWARALSLALVLLVILVFSWLVILVFSRRFRAWWLPPSPPPPTPADDLWARHRLPPDALRDWVDEPPPDGPAGDPPAGPPG